MDNNSSSSQTVAMKDNSLVNKVKGLVVRAWRERWNDVQWGIYLKRAIQAAPAGTDTKELAGKYSKACILILLAQSPVQYDTDSLQWYSVSEVPLRARSR